VARVTHLEGLQGVFSFVNDGKEEIVGCGFQRLVLGAGWFAGRGRVEQAIQELEQVVETGDTERVYELMDAQGSIGLFERQDSAAGCEAVLTTLKELRREWPFRQAELKHRVALFPTGDV